MVVHHHHSRNIAGGATPGCIINIIEYITIASEGNAIDFGDLTQGWNK